MNNQLRILILEDTPTDAELTRRELRRAGIFFTARCVETREDFLRELEAFEPDIILSDYGLPQFNGLEALRLVHEREVQAPFILITGSLPEEVAVECMKEGADDYILKTSLKRLPSAVLNALKKRTTELEKDRALSALRRGEELYRLLAENTSDLICMVDVGGNFVYVSPSSREILGYEPEQLLGRRCSSLLHADDKKAEKKRFRDSLTSKQGYTTEFRCRHRQGDWIIFETKSRWIFDWKGNPTRAVFVSRDISKRKQAEARLRESEERYRLLVEGVKDYAIFMLDTEGRVASWNKGAERIKGYRAEEIIGEHFSRFYSRQDAERGKPERALRLATEEGHYEDEGWRIRRDGSRFFAQVTITPLIDEAGQLRGFSKVTRDITERKQAAEALEASEERYRRLVELSPETIAVHYAGRFVYVNAAGTKLFGAESPEELVGLPIFDVVHPDYLEQAKARALQNYEGHQTPLSELKIIRLDGEVVDVEVTGFPTTYEDRPAVQVIIRDITERKRAEEALRRTEEQLQQSQKLEAIGQLAGGIAHDFNNLLTVINGYSDLSMRRLAPDDPLRRNLEGIRKAGTSAAALTSQLLAFSRKQVLQPRVLELNSILTHMDKMLRRLIDEDIELLTVLDPELGQVKADSGQIEQIVMNLVVNARDAMPRGGKLTVETSNVYLDESYSRQHIAVQPGPHVMIAVSDTGCGMSAEVQKRIFEPFFTTKELGKGTGLGLSTVYGIVKQSGGHLWVYSEKGRGTTFKIYLPRVDEAAETISTSNTSESVPEGWETILIVEDEQMVRDFAASVLREQGYKVLEASNGEEALKLAQGGAEESIHLLLTDTVMPRMSGPELANRLKKLRPEARVLFMSGYTDKSIVRHGVLEEGTHFIQKPFAFEDLARKVRDVLDARERTRSDTGMRAELEVVSEYAI